MNLFVHYLVPALFVATATALNCTSVGDVCVNCNTTGNCAAVNVLATETPCVPADQACSVGGTCKPFGETTCNCGNKTVGCDPFDGAPITCTPGVGVRRGTPCDSDQKCVDGMCERCGVKIVNKRFPHFTNCKRYFTCRLVVGSSYRFVESACPGQFVFNPQTLFCDEVKNVKGCKA